MDTSDKTPSSRWEVLSRNRAARMIAGRLVLDGEIELSEGNGRYTYIHCTNLNDIYTFRVAGTSILDDVEDREFSPYSAFLCHRMNGSWKNIPAGKHTGDWKQAVLRRTILISASWLFRWMKCWQARRKMKRRRPSIHGTARI